MSSDIRNDLSYLLLILLELGLVEDGVLWAGNIKFYSHLYDPNGPTL